MMNVWDKSNFSGSTVSSFFGSGSGSGFVVLYPWRVDIFLIGSGLSRRRWGFKAEGQDA